MKRTWMMALIVMSVLTSSGLQSCRRDDKQDRNTIVIGESTKVFSKHLNREMIADIYLPEGYSTNESKYPVLFTCQSSLLHICGITADLAFKREIPRMIVVSIRNYSSDDFIPEKIEGHPNSGNADKFIVFFKEEMIPFIDSHYRTHPFRVFYSGSFGGGFSVYTMLAHPDVFNACIAATPAIDFEGSSTLIPNKAAAFLEAGNFENRFLYMGIENEPMLLPVLDKFVVLLTKAKLAGFIFEYHQFFDEDHYSIANKVIFHGLRFVFSGWNNIPDKIAGRSIDEIRDYILGLKGTYGFDIGISNPAVHKVLRKYREEKKIKEEIDLLKLALEFNPDSEMMWLELGRAYEADNQMGQAISTLRIAHQKAVQNSSPHLGIFVDALERIEKK